jgi:xanthine dehydrogenase iron-sulfur cluster and FAD-binding subunit A
MKIETPHSRNSDPITSHLAGDEITKSGKRQTQINKVNHMVRLHEGLTSAELAESNKADRYMVARRLADSLEVKKGEPRICAVSGRKAVTWWVA